MWSLTNFGLNLRPGKCPQAKEFWFFSHQKLWFPVWKYQKLAKTDRGHFQTYKCSKMRCTGKMAPPDENLINAHSQHRRIFSSGPGSSNFWTVVMCTIPVCKNEALPLEKCHDFWRPHTEKCVQRVLGMMFTAQQTVLVPTGLRPRI